MSLSITKPDLTTTQTDHRPAERLRPRRTLNRLATALAGVAAAVIGQIIFEHGSIWEALLFYGLGLLLFVRALANHPYPNYRFSLDLHLSQPFIRPGWRRSIGAWLILFAFGLSIVAYAVFEAEAGTAPAWWLYLASLVLLVSGGLLLGPGSSHSAELRRLFPNRPVLTLFIAILGLTVFMRLYNFTELPFGIWYDEAEAGLQARRMLHDEDYRPLFYPTINVTGHLLAAYALAMRWLGDNIYAMRFVSVLFGLGGVVAAYLFGHSLRGPRFGLLLALLLAVARWHVNFSRIAMTGVDTPFFEFLSLFFLVRFFRYGRLRDALWAGLTLGFGLMFYTAFRLFILALLIFALLIITRWPAQIYAALRRNGWQRYAGAAALLLVSIWIVTAPLVKVALANPEGFWYRTRQISIFTRRDQADLWQALWNTTSAHLLMFNYLGDKNGRHNLPGEPMLDPATAVLFVLGLGLALARTRYPANSFFLILFPLALAGGIFSVDFEAPQSLRSIAVIPAAIYFAGLALVALGREAEAALRPLPRVWLWGPAAAIAAYMIVTNAYIYFGRQANDFASWNAFSAPETITGRQMARLGPGYDYILSPFLTNHPTTKFLAPQITVQHWLNLPDALPIRTASGKPAALFIHPDDAWVFEKAQQFYPNAHFDIFSAPDPLTEEGPASVYFIELQSEDLVSVRGLELRYWPQEIEDEQTTPVTAPLRSSRAYTIDAVWPDDSPTPAGFVAEWTGTLYAPRYGPYTFRLVSPGPGLLEIDGHPVLSGQGEQLAGLRLAEGNHRLRVRAEAGTGPVALYWQPPGLGEELVPAWALYGPPVTNHGLLASFYTNNNWEGQPALQRIDPFLDTYFHLIPFNRPYTVEWSGSLVAPQTGLYQLALRVVQEAELFVDGRQVLAALQPNQITEAAVTLEGGLHDITIRYRDSVDRSRVHFYWLPPNGVFEPVPSEFLWPPMGDYPAVAQPLQDSFEPLPLTLKHRVSLGSPGSEPGQFLEPRDVAVLSNGNVVVADTGNRRVQIFDRLHNYLAELDGGDLPFTEPLAVGVNSQDQILVLDSTLQWIYRYRPEGGLIDRFGGPEARLFHPRGLTVLEDDTVALADTGSARIALFSPDGRLTGSIGSLGSAPGQLNEPTDLLKDDQGTFFVVEAENGRIQRLDAGGNPLNQWPIPPAYAYNGPHLAFAPDRSILMTEAQTDTLLRYSPTGVILDQWRIIDPVTLVDPVGLYFDANTGLLYITDVGTHQLHIFELGLAVSPKLGDN
jgi:DNA-binding beta-propeller fold protein YncE/4-amino-4-deoxy-L-arabinose transferase-like glycosyltransferase